MSGAKRIVQTQLPENTFFYEIEIETRGKKESKGEEGTLGSQLVVAG